MLKVKIKLNSALLEKRYAIVAGAVGVMYKRITRTCKEAGEFLAALGTALEDKKITREELISLLWEEFYCINI